MCNFSKKEWSLPTFSILCDFCKEGRGPSFIRNVMFMQIRASEDSLSLDHWFIPAPCTSTIFQFTYFLLFASEWGKVQNTQSPPLQYILYAIWSFKYLLILNKLQYYQYIYCELNHDRISLCQLYPFSVISSKTLNWLI